MDHGRLHGAPFDPGLVGRHPHVALDLRADLLRRDPLGEEGAGWAEGVPPVEDVRDLLREELPVGDLEDPLDAEPLGGRGEEAVVRSHEEGPLRLDYDPQPLAAHSGVDDADVDRPPGEVGGATGHVEGPLLDAVVPHVVADVYDRRIRQDLENRSLDLGDVGVLDPVVREKGYYRHTGNLQGHSDLNSLHHDMTRLT